MIRENSLRSSIRELRSSVRHEEVKQARMNNHFVNEVMAEVLGLKQRESVRENQNCRIVSESLEDKLNFASDHFMAQRTNYRKETPITPVFHSDGDQTQDILTNQLIELIKAMSITPKDDTHQPDGLEKYFSNLTLDIPFQPPLPSARKEAQFSEHPSTKPGSESKPAVSNSDLTHLLQKSDSLTTFADFQVEDWMLALKPKKPRGILIVVPGRAVVITGGGFKREIDAAVMGKYLHKETVLGSIFDVFVECSEKRVEIDIFDALLLEGKPMFELPAEVRYYFLYSKFFCDNAICRLPVPGLSSPFEEFMNRVTIIEEATLEISLICLHSCTYSSLIKIRNNKQSLHDGSLLLINRNGEYRVNQTSEDLLLLKDLQTSLSLGRNQVMPLKFEKSSSSFWDPVKSHRIRVDTTCLVEEWSFTQDEPDDPLASPLKSSLSFTTPDQSALITMHKKVFWRNKKSKSLLRLKHGSFYSVAVVNHASASETGSQHSTRQQADGSIEDINLQIYGEYLPGATESTPASVDDLQAYLQNTSTF